MRLKLKHSKLRNTGLLYEFLLRQITADVLNKSGQNTAVKIVKKVFNENTELGKELALYSVLINTKFNSDQKAEYFINEVLNNYQKLNKTKLKREKYNLVKEINDTYNSQKLFSSKIENYKIYANIYKLLEYNSLLSPEEKTETHFNLVEHITTKSNSIKLSETVVDKKLAEDEDLRILTYKTLLEKFNSKYSKLNLARKNLLRAYINNVSNTNSLKEHIEKVKPNIKKELQTYSKYVNDKVVKIKLKEAINSIDKFCSTQKSNLIKDSVVVQFMRYMELLKELKKCKTKLKD
jgi:hypothetical protein